MIELSLVLTIGLSLGLLAGDTLSTRRWRNERIERRVSALIRH